jgi:hypothetical protein
MHEIDLRQVAYARSGDKGDTSNIVVAPFDEADYGWLRKHLTESLVAERFAEFLRGPLTRYEMPGIRALNFVMERALEGGVSRSLNLDAHGKSRSNLMLSIQIRCSELPPSRAAATTPANHRLEERPAPGTKVTQPT